MAVYTTLDTILDAMKRAKHLKFRVEDDEGNRLLIYEPGTNDTLADAQENLKAFVQQLTGDTYVFIKTYGEKFRGSIEGENKRGGDTSDMQKFRLKLYNEQRQTRSEESREPRPGVGLDNNYLELFKSNLELKFQMEKLQWLQSQEKKSNRDVSAFDRVADRIAKTMVEEFVNTDTKNAPGVIAENVSEQPKKNVDDNNREIIKSVAVLCNVGGKENVSEGLKKMAEMAKTNPFKLAELLKAVGESE